MPGQLLAQPNPPPEPSLIPESILQSEVKLDTKNYLPSDELEGLQAFQRAANYLSAGKHRRCCGVRMLYSHILQP